MPAALSAWFESTGAAQRTWLVGGAVRDFFLNRRTVDLDFAVTHGALELARGVADALDGDVYALDRERGTARVLLDKAGAGRRVLDFSNLRGGSIEADLQARDFSINALAILLAEPETLIDPCHGAVDLRRGAIRTCTPDSILADPVRGLRALRLAGELGFAIEAETRDRIRGAAGELAAVSRERIRDELFRMLAVDEPAVMLHLARHFGFERALFAGELPEAAFNRLQAVLRELAAILRSLAPAYDPESAANASLGLLVWQLGRYRTDLQSYLQQEVAPFRRLRELLYLSCQTWQAGREATALEGLRLSQSEERWMQDFWSGMEHIEQVGSTELALYRFFRQARSAGVACCLVWLAGRLADGKPGLQAGVWAEDVQRGRLLFEAYFERREQVIDPQPILDGEDVMRELGITPGPQVGQILEWLREQQVSGTILNREQAVEALHRLDPPLA